MLTQCVHVWCVICVWQSLCFFVLAHVYVLYVFTCNHVVNVRVLIFFEFVLRKELVVFFRSLRTILVCASGLGLAKKMKLVIIICTHSHHNQTRNQNVKGAHAITTTANPHEPVV